MTTEMIRSTNKKTSRQDVLVCEEIDRATFMHQKYIWWWRQQKLSSVIHRVPAPGDANKTGFHGLPRRAVDVWGDHWQPRSAGEGPHCPISTPRVQQRGSRMVAAVATGAICSPSLGSGMRYGRRSRWIGRRMCALAASSEHARAAEGHARCPAWRREEGQTAREDNRR